MSRKFLTGIDLTNQKIVNSASASAGTDVPNWAQVQALAYGLSWKSSVRAASTANITIASPGATIDGVTMMNGDSFIAKNQTTASENGIYTWVGASSPAARRADAVQGTLGPNTTVYVNEGTTNADTGWTLTTNNTITIGTTSLAFAQIGGGTAYSNGYGVTLTGSVFAIDTTKIPSKYASNIGDGTSTSFTVTHSLGTLDVMVQVYNNTTGEKVDADFGTGRTVTALPLTFATAPTSSQYRVIVIG